MALRYIMVGLGNFGAKRRASLGERCVATVDPCNEAADFRTLIEVPADIYDAAVLSVPNSLKIDLLRQVLGLGKHALVEKPTLFCSAPEAEEMENLARRNNVIWYTSYNHRFEPLVVRLRGALEGGVIGTLYHARLVYGNGTVRNCLNTWRDSGLGVIEDLGCHLIDLIDFLFGYRATNLVLQAAEARESSACDHAVMATPEGNIILECGLTMWKNCFSIDAFGDSGSVHLNGLCKWGTSELIERQRVFPSGVPLETRHTAQGADLSWIPDVEEFERRVLENRSTCEVDRRISITLTSLAHQLRQQ